MSKKNMTKILSGAAMAALLATPATSMAASTSTLDNPNGGAPILVEHPQSAPQTNGTNNVIGAGASQAANSAKENIAFGTDASITVHSGGDDASFDTAVGHEASINGSGGTAVGAAAKVDALFGGTAIGTASTAKGGQMGTAIGYMSTADGNFATSVGANANATGANSEAIGANSSATGSNSTAIGVGASATGANSVALGKGSVATQDNTLSIGTEGSTRRITNVTAGIDDTDGVNVSQLKQGLGGKANIDLDNITEAGKNVIRNLAQVNADIDISSSDSSIAVLKNTDGDKILFDVVLSKDQVFNSVEVNELNVTGDTVIGTDKGDTLTVNATTNLKNDVIIGEDKSDTLTVNSTTNLKGDVTVDGDATFNGKVQFNNDVAFNGNVDARSFSVNGETYISEDGIDAHNHKVINVADGDIREGSKDAINGGQLHRAMNDLRNDVQSDIEDATGEVGAQAAAMSALHPLEYDKDNKVSVSASVGAYKSNAAGAIGAFYRPDKNSMIGFQGAIGKNDNMYAIGYSQKFGHVSAEDEQLDNLDKVNSELAALKAENKDLKDKYDQILAMLSDKSGLPARVVSEVVVAPVGDDGTVDEDGSIVESTIDTAADTAIGAIAACGDDSDDETEGEIGGIDSIIAETAQYDTEKHWVKGEDGLYHEVTVR